MHAESRILKKNFTTHHSKIKKSLSCSGTISEKMKKIAVIAICTLLLVWACKKEREQVLQQVVKPTKPAMFQTKSYGDHNNNLLSNIASLVTVSNGMLKFNSQEDFDDYLDALDNFLEQWNYSDEDEYTVGDEALNALDASLGFSSLRYVQDETYDEIGPEATFPINVPSYTLASVLNNKYEIWIGDEIYRLMEHDYMAIISKSNFEILELLDDYSFFAENDDLVFEDLKTGLRTTNPPYPGGPKRPNAASCDMYLTETTIDPTQRRIHIFFQNINASGNVDPTNIIDLVDYTMTVKTVGGTSIGSDHWIGFGLDTRDFVFPSPTPTFYYDDYDVTIIAQVLSSGENCPQITTTRNKTIRIRIPNPSVATCIGGNVSKNIGNTFQNDEYNVTGSVWQQNTGWFEGIGATTRFYKKINGSYRARKPDNWLYAGYDGFFVTQNCSILSSQKTSSKQERKKCLEVRTSSIQTTFATWDDVDNAADAMYGFFEADNGSGSWTLQSTDIH